MYLDVIAITFLLLLLFDTPTAKARGILEKFGCLRNPYSQRACQQPSTQSLKAEVLFTFPCNVAAAFHPMAGAHGFSRPVSIKFFLFIQSVVLQLAF